MTEVFYRYEDVMYAPSLDEFDNPSGPSKLVVHLREYKVLRHTPCGVRLTDGRFVNTQRRKQFAHATKELAKASFIARKERQAAIYQARVNRAERAIRLVNNPDSLGWLDA